MKKWPTQIYVKRETDENDPKTALLLTEETPAFAEDGDDVAIYTLQDVKTKRVTHTLE